MEVDVDSDNECVAAAAEKKTKEKKDKKAIKAPKQPKPSKPAAPAGDEAFNEAGDEASDGAVVVGSADDGFEVEDAGACGDEVGDAGAGGEDQSDDGMSLTGAGKRKRRKTITDQLTQQQDDLCDWYRNTFFYNKMNREYRNADKKKAVMMEKARSLNLMYDDLLKYFASLSTQYGKLKLKTSGQAAVKKLLTHYQFWVLDNYAFL